MPLENDDAGAQQSGQKAFAAIRSAIGVPQPTDTIEFHDIAFEVQAGARATRFRPVRL